MISRLLIGMLAVASAAACTPALLDPADVPHVPSADARRACADILTDIASDAAIEHRAVVAAFETTVGGLRTIESDAGDLGPTRDQLWPEMGADDPAVLCYLDVGSVRAGPVPGPITRFVIAYAAGPDQSGWAGIDAGPPERIQVPW